MRHLALLAAAALLAGLPQPGRAADPTPLLPHRAVYALQMDHSRGDVTTASGEMRYEITDACDGWASRQRLQMNVTNRDGQDIALLSDYVTWESKDGHSMRFRTRQTTDGAVTDQVEGSATLDADGTGTIHYTLPEDKTVKLPAGTLFSTAHTEAVIHAAASGQKFLAVPVFDGTGSKGAQDSFVVIGGWGPTASAPYPALGGQDSGRVHISFFDRDSQPAADKASGVPDYEVGMVYYADGVANDLMMDFGDFTMHGTFKSFEENPPHC